MSTATNNEKTLVLVKPDGVARGLVGEVIARIEAKGYSISALRMLQADRALLEKHYAEHKGKPFFEPLLEFNLLGDRPFRISDNVQKQHSRYQGSRR